VPAAVAISSAEPILYARRHPERSSLYEVVRDNLETLSGAIADGALEVRLAKHAKHELEAYLDCGLLCRGFARLRCGACKESRLVAFSCKGRGFCPSCLGRRMCQTAANLVECVLPEVALRQWVLTFPFSWRRRLAHDGDLLGALTRLFVATVQRFYARRSPHHPAKTGAVVAVQRTSSDMRLNPHLHVIFLDGAYHEDGAELAWSELGHLQSREVGAVLEAVVRRIERHLRRRGLLRLEARDDDCRDVDPDEALAASAVSGREPPAGPQWLHGLSPLAPSALRFDKPLCTALDGFTLHAATRAGALDVIGREALLRYVLRPPIAQERVEPRPDGLVRITLKRPFADGTVAATWTHSRSSAASLRACRRRATTPSSTPACSPTEAAGARASRRVSLRRAKSQPPKRPATSPPHPSPRLVAAAIGPGPSSSPEPSASTCSRAPNATAG
jgi:Transposase zinc-binding domain/Putative transposase